MLLTIIAIQLFVRFVYLQRRLVLARRRLWAGWGGSGLDVGVCDLCFMDSDASFSTGASEAVFFVRSWGPQARWATRVLQRAGGVPVAVDRCSGWHGPLSLLKQWKFVSFSALRANTSIFISRGALVVLAVATGLSRRAVDEEVRTGKVVSLQVCWTQAQAALPLPFVT